MNFKTAIIIGAGPAGLTCAYELLQRTDIKPIVIEKDYLVGGITRTVNYKGNRIDLGGHRFFSKSDKIMQWWLKILPAEDPTGKKELAPAKQDEVMLIRKRKSRIYFLRKFFNYPVTLNIDTLKNLGFKKTFLIGLAYLKSVLFPIKPVKNLEDFFINRFGKELYETFFESYTEKVWGIPCNKIAAEWGAQRIKGLSVGKTLLQYFRKLFRNKTDLGQKHTETSLIEQFLYPKFGPGQLWEKVASEIQEKGGKILRGFEVNKIYLTGQRIKRVEARGDRGEKKVFRGNYFFSTMPICELVRALQTKVPPKILEISEGLVYRDFLTVGLLLRDLKLKDEQGKLVSDNWIYIQEPEVRLGRLQIFNNWSSYLVANPNTVWIGLEYFCNEGDEIWEKSDRKMIQFAIAELAKINIIAKEDVLDATVIRMPKTYPAYFGTYNRFRGLRKYLDQFENLFLIGRNGMHRYNNQDHSMLTAMTAVDNIIAGRKDKSNIWAVNAEQEYQEEK